VLFLFFLGLGPLPSYAETQWQQVTEEEGIVVTMRQLPGRSFPTFRGVGLINANIYQVLAVMSDIARHTEWLEQCLDSRLLRKINKRQYIVYSRTHAPWPVSDRDAVYQSKVEFDATHSFIHVQFWAIPSSLMHPVKGVVRMTDLQGHWKLWARQEHQTLMEYQVNADPKGLLPQWVAKLATKNLPLHTIRNLRQQVKKTQNWYSQRIAQWKSEQ
jgi:hypothetical protein